MSETNQLQQRKQGRVTVGIIRRRKELYSEYHDTAGTLIVANIALVALYATILFYLVDFGYLTQSNFRNEEWLQWGIVFWSTATGLCIVSRYIARQRRAALVDILDAHDLRSPLPSIDKFGDRFNATPLRANLIASELLVIAAFVTTVSSLLVAPPILPIVLLGFLLFCGVLVAAYITISNLIAREILSRVADRRPNWFTQHHNNVYRTELTGPDIELQVNGIVLVVLAVLLAIAIEYLL